MTYKITFVAVARYFERPESEQREVIGVFKTRAAAESAASRHVAAERASWGEEVESWVEEQWTAR